MLIVAELHPAFPGGVMGSGESMAAMPEFTSHERAVAAAEGLRCSKAPMFLKLPRNQEFTYCKIQQLRSRITSYPELQGIGTEVLAPGGSGDTARSCLLTNKDLFQPASSAGAGNCFPIARHSQLTTRTGAAKEGCKK